MDKRFLAIIGVIVVIFLGVVLFNHNGSSGGGTSGSNGQPTNHVEGNVSSKVTLVEYGDYQCPVCEGYYQTVQQVQQKYNATVKFQFRNLPLSQIHPLALEAARAAEAADMQGKFWQMHDMLYNPQNYETWAYDPATQEVRSADPTALFKSYAKAIGLNVTKFQADLASATANDRVQADLAAFNKTGQQEATPTFFLNGKYVPNSKLVDSNGPSVNAFSSVLDAALKSTGQGG
jgi:protein-disulfide isomerase